MHSIPLVLTLTVALTGALILGFIAHRLKLPAIVGYLLAGVIIGPYTPGFVANRELAEQLAEVGVILLMFGVGLHFHVKDFLAVRKIALSGALVQISSATLLGAAGAHALGWSWTSGVVFGISLSVASTVVLTRVLADNRDLQTQTGRIAIGWLVVEDVFTVFVVVVLPAVVGTGAGSQSLPMAMAVSTLKLVALAALALGPGAKIMPRILSAAASTHSRELFTLTVLAIALGIAVLSSELFGVSMALGAFLAGMTVGQSEFSYRAASEALPMRDAFAVLFFVSVGMLFDPHRLLAAPMVTALTLGIVMLGKPLAAFLIVQALGYGARVGLRVAVSLAQIGEFSFILAVLGNQLKVLPVGATDSMVAASIASITLNPLIYRAIPAIEKRFIRGKRKPARELPTEVAAEGAHQAGAVVVGYGPVGEGVCRLLREREIRPTVIELNIGTVRRLVRDGLRAVYGDAAQADVLDEAGVRTASTLIIAAPGTAEFSEVIRAARAMNPEIHILARSGFLKDAQVLLEAGADLVYSGEAEVASAMIEATLLHLGATPEQAFAERERARTQLYK